MAGNGPAMRRTDVGEDERYVERYVVTSWAEYVRLRMRMTVADRMLQNRVMELQRKDTPIRVSRLIGVNRPRG